VDLFLGGEGIETLRHGLLRLFTIYTEKPVGQPAALQPTGCLAFLTLKLFRVASTPIIFVFSLGIIL